MRVHLASRFRSSHFPLCFRHPFNPHRDHCYLSDHSIASIHCKSYIHRPPSEFKLLVIGQHLTRDQQHFPVEAVHIVTTIAKDAQRTSPKHSFCLHQVIMPPKPITYGPEADTQKDADSHAGKHEEVRHDSQFPGEPETGPTEQVQSVVERIEEEAPKTTSSVSQGQETSKERNNSMMPQPPDSARSLAETRRPSLEIFPPPKAYSPETQAWKHLVLTGSRQNENIQPQSPGAFPTLPEGEPSTPKGQSAQYAKVVQAVASVGSRLPGTQTNENERPQPAAAQQRRQSLPSSTPKGFTPSNPHFTTPQYASNMAAGHLIDTKSMAEQQRKLSEAISPGTVIGGQHMSPMTERQKQKSAVRDPPQQSQRAPQHTVPAASDERPERREQARSQSGEGNEAGATQPVQPKKISFGKTDSVVEYKRIAQQNEMHSLMRRPYWGLNPFSGQARRAGAESDPSSSSASSEHSGSDEA